MPAADCNQIAQSNQWRREQQQSGHRTRLQKLLAFKRKLERVDGDRQSDGKPTPDDERPRRPQESHDREAHAGIGE